MPKKKKASRKPAGSRTTRPVQQLIHGPARTLLNYPEDDTEMAELLGAWPYRISGAEGTGGRTSLNHTAAGSATTLREAAQSMVNLEDAGLLLWDAAADQYLLVAQEPAQ